MDEVSFNFIKHSFSRTQFSKTSSLELSCNIPGTTICFLKFITEDRNMHAEYVYKHTSQYPLATVECVEH